MSQTNSKAWIKELLIIMIVEDELDGHLLYQPPKFVLKGDPIKEFARVVC
jgi:hypothetical protein